jgi:hypothetical protein
VTVEPTISVRRKKDLPGAFSLASVMALPVGDAIDPAGVRGYHIDMRVKAQEPVWPPPWLGARDDRLWVVLVQYGLGAWERHVAGEGEEWLGLARSVADELVDSQGPDGAWRHGYDYPHTFDLKAGWLSSITQGEAASLLVRLHAETGEERYAAAARLALKPMSVPSAEGGCRTLVNGRPFPEEYPTDPPSFVLNGAFFAIWGLRDVAVGLGDAGAQAAWDEAVVTLTKTIARWDTGWWSRYDLFPHVLPNIASSFYHQLHIAQLRATAVLTGDEAFTAVADRWEGYAASRVNRNRAFAAKVAFRLAVPRNQTLATRMPWARRALTRRAPR